MTHLHPLCLGLFHGDPSLFQQHGRRSRCPSVGATKPQPQGHLCPRPCCRCLWGPGCDREHCQDRGRRGGTERGGDALRPRTHFIPSHLYWISRLSGLGELVYPIKVSLQMSPARVQPQRPGPPRFWGTCQGAGQEGGGPQEAGPPPRHTEGPQNPHRCWWHPWDPVLPRLALRLAEEHPRPATAPSASPQCRGAAGTLQGDSPVPNHPGTSSPKNDRSSAPNPPPPRASAEPEVSSRPPRQSNRSVAWQITPPPPKKKMFPPPCVLSPCLSPCHRVPLQPPGAAPNPPPKPPYSWEGSLLNPPPWCTGLGGGISQPAAPHRDLLAEVPPKSLLGQGGVPTAVPCRGGTSDALGKVFLGGHPHCTAHPTPFYAPPPPKPYLRVLPGPAVPAAEQGQGQQRVGKATERWQGEGGLPTTAPPSSQHGCRRRVP